MSDVKTFNVKNCFSQINVLLSLIEPSLAVIDPNPLLNVCSYSDAIRYVMEWAQTIPTLLQTIPSHFH